MKKRVKYEIYLQKRLILQTKSNTGCNNRRLNLPFSFNSLSWCAINFTQ